MFYNGMFFGFFVYFMIIVWSVLNGIMIMKTQYLELPFNHGLNERRAIEGRWAAVLGVALFVFGGLNFVLLVLWMMSSF